MMIFSGDIKIEYGVTRGGQFFEKHEIGHDRSYIRSTPDAERFMRWMIQSEVDQDLIDTKRERMIKVLKLYWAIRSTDILRGSFNEELYKKIIKAKKENGTLHR